RRETVGPGDHLRGDVGDGAASRLGRAGRRLRQHASDAEHAERLIVMAMDPVLFSTTTNILHSIANEMGTVMLLSAYSSIAREAKDTSTCLCDASGRVVAQSMMIPMHMNSLSSAVAYLRENFDLAATGEDEVYVMNHPYTNGQHLHDIIIM